jgi:preprotein translocase subunit SecD
MKTTTLSLMLILLASAYASKAQSDAPPAKPQFVIMPGDVVSTSVETVTNDVITSAPIKETTVVHLDFTSDKAAAFRKFTRQHLKQTVQILVGTNVVATPMIESEIPSRKIYLNFSTPEEATRVSSYLMTK